MTQQPRYTRQEFLKRGSEIYESIRSRVEKGNRGKVVAIDIETGEYEVARDTLEASDRLRARCPDAQTWFVRIGHRGLHRFGPRLVTSPA